MSTFRNPLKNPMSADQWLKILVAFTGFVMTWHSRAILGKIDRIEAQIHTLDKNQVKILTTLGVEPCALNIPDTRVKTPIPRPFGPVSINQVNQNIQKFWSLDPGQSDKMVVSDWVP